MAIFNQYKNTLNDFTNSLDLESLDWAKLIDERSHNASIFEGNLANFLERNYLDKNLLERSLWLALKTQDLQVR